MTKTASRTRLALQLVLWRLAKTWQPIIPHYICVKRILALKVVSPRFVLRVRYTLTRHTRSVSLASSVGLFARSSMGLLTRKEKKSNPTNATLVFVAGARSFARVNLTPTMIIKGWSEFLHLL